MIRLFKKRMSKNEIKRIEEEKRIKNEIEKIRAEIEKTNMWFETETNDNLIEACIHQRNSLSAKYQYFIEKLKPMENE